MKSFRRVIWISVFLLIFAVCFASCDKNEEKPADTGSDSADISETTSGPEESGEGPHVKKTEDELRKIALDYMIWSSEVLWTANRDIDFSAETAFTSKTKYTAGTRYQGVIYSPKRSSTHLFLHYVVDGVYIGGTSWLTALGTTCSTSIFASWKQISNSFTASATQNMLPTSNTGILPVGEYQWDAIKTYSGDITQASGRKTMNLAYSCLKPGDAVVCSWPYDESKGHTRMVMETPTVVLRNDGDILGSKSTVKTIEQTSGMQNNGKYPTTWKVGYVYSFDQLFSDFYIPVTVSELATGEYETPDIQLEGGNNARNIVAGLKGTVVSNYFINQITCEVFDAENKSAMQKVFLPEGNSCELTSSDFRLTELSPGFYHISITVFTGIEEKVVLDLDFERK